MSLVALITDFGISDWFVGEMKGAMLTACPTTTILDITHHIVPGDIRGAAFTLAACYRTFPQRTTFCVVVDPGVGSDRKAICADSGRYLFVGPDNGVLSWAFAREEGVTIRTIDNSDFFHNGALSSTFHGRDIFGPVAAHLAHGAPLVTVGAETVDYLSIPFPEPTIRDDIIAAEILTVDRFGNAVTSVGPSERGLLHEKKVQLTIDGTAAGELVYAEYFAAVLPQEALCYFGAAGYLEIGVNGGSAAERFDLRPGTAVELLLR
ncbi:MAG: SAM-dependent chlorinase/fluorinase [Chitinispirillaceae bacterium]|nr:SAM-dependent chlorinase/fluorinase [Chitinispirillaceae bacterium]